MDIINIVKRKVKNNEYSDSHQILLPALSFNQSQQAYTRLVHFKETSKENECMCFGVWGQLNNLRCININNDVYIFTTSETMNNKNGIEPISTVGQLFLMDDNYLNNLKN
tara:strand:- start:1872 stop:2201 length:330 start_codon:yes stop_codon:yes gene_type:complete